jgi:hypothetical protein
MKTIQSVLVFVAVVLTVSFSYAGKNTQVNMVPQEGKKMVVVVTNQEPCRFALSILDDQGDAVYYKWVTKKTESYKKLFDFSKLREGRYIVTLNTKGTSIEKEMVVTVKQVMTPGSLEIASTK